MTDEQQPEALRLADALVELDAQFSQPGLCGEAAAELRRLHEQNADYANTIDGLIISSCDDVARIVALEDLRDELLEVLELFPGFTDDATIGDSWLWKVGATIAKAGGAA